MPKMQTKKNTVYRPLMSRSDRKAVAEFRKAAKEFTEEATKSPEAALQALVDLGIYTPSGKLRKQYSR